MKQALALSFGLIFLVPAASRADVILVNYADLSGHCSLQLQLPGLLSLYVVQRVNTGSVASAWRVDDPSGMTRIGASVPTGYLSIGDPYTDVQVAYGGCIIGDHVLFSLHYFVSAEDAALPCAVIRILPAPTSPIPGELVVVDCAQPSGNLEAATTRPFVINGPSDPVECECPPVAAESATWGKIKSLYR
jgi:hypothetical protein